MILRLTGWIVPLIVFSALEGCAGGNLDQYPSDFHVLYVSRSGLVGYETRIDVTVGEIRLFHTDPSHNDTLNESYQAGAHQVLALYRQVDSTSFLSIMLPARLTMPDVPEEFVTVAFGGRMNTLEFGGARELPQAIAGVRSLLFELAGQHSRRWREEVRY